MKKKNADEQVFENELKKLKLQAEYGSTFIENPKSEISPELESSWLDSIMAFEEAAKKKEVKKVREVLGMSFPSLAVIEPEEIGDVLEAAMKILNQNGIAVGTCYDVPEQELYQFISEDLLEVEMNVLDVPGWTTQFTYEDFHPNHKEDIKRDVCDFVDSMFKGNPDSVEWKLQSPFAYNGIEYAVDEFLILAKKATSGKGLELVELTLQPPVVSGLRGKVTASLEYLLSGDRETKTDQVFFEFANEYDWWMIEIVSFPPINLFS